MVEASSAVRAPETPELCSEYRPIAGTYDEMCGQPGRLRAHWQYLVDSFETMGLPELERRRQEARRLIRDNGVTYNVYGDPQGVSRPWELDLVPLLIRSEEWSRIERGLIQRAEVLNLLLADLYGAGSVISKGVLPPELVMSHPGFQRPCVGITMPDQHYLPLYAADLARAPDGKTWVIGDRGQVPSGAGYALENRIVLSRVLPSVFRDSHVHRLALFFRTMRSTLAAMAPRETDSPRVVVMTPGPSA